MVSSETIGSLYSSSCYSISSAKCLETSGNIRNNLEKLRYFLFYQCKEDKISKRLSLADENEPKMM